MTFDITKLIGETTDYDKKQELEIRRPKSWCKSVSVDIFSRLKYMERRGSGFKKICNEYAHQVNYRDELKPIFRSNDSDFVITFYNLNYGISGEKITNEGKEGVNPNDNNDNGVNGVNSETTLSVSQTGTECHQTVTKLSPNCHQTWHQMAPNGTNLNLAIIPIYIIFLRYSEIFREVPFHF